MFIIDVCYKSLTRLVQFSLSNYPIIHYSPSTYYDGRASMRHLRGGGAFPHPRNSGRVCSCCMALVSSSTCDCDMAQSHSPIPPRSHPYRYCLDSTYHEHWCKPKCYRQSIWKRHSRPPHNGTSGRALLIHNQA